MQYCEITLDPGETVTAEAGAMMYMTDGIRMETLFGDPSQQGQGFLGKLAPTVDYEIQFVGGFKNAILGGEGLFLATLTGPGKIWCQSLPFSHLAGRVLANASRTGGKDEGSLLGSFGKVLMGDGRCAFPEGRRFQDVWTARKGGPAGMSDSAVRLICILGQADTILPDPLSLGHSLKVCIQTRDNVQSFRNLEKLREQLLAQLE